MHALLIKTHQKTYQVILATQSPHESSGEADLPRKALAKALTRAYLFIFISIKLAQIFNVRRRFLSAIHTLHHLKTASSARNSFQFSITNFVNFRFKSA